MQILVDRISDYYFIRENVKEISHKDILHWKKAWKDLEKEIKNMLNADLNDNQFFEGKEICGWFNEDGTIMIQFINKGASFQISRTANDNIELLEELEE